MTTNLRTSRAIFFILGSLVFVLLVGGCSPSSTPTSAPADASRGITVMDRLDREVRFAEPPKRIVSLSPAATELVFAIGAGEQLVGATKHCNYPPAAQSLPRVGAGTLESMSRETILSLKPDLVICKWDYHQPLMDTLERLKIPTLALGADRLEELYDEAELLGKVCGHEAESRAMVETMQSEIASLSQRVPETAPLDRPTVFYEVWDDPLMTAAPGSFIGELLELAGLRNIFDDATTRYPKVSAEVVVARNPDIILAPSTHAAAVSMEQLSQRPGWTDITAIREGRAHLVDGDCVSRCGPRLVIAFREMIDAVYGTIPSTSLEESLR
jgi:iron complex transport system substrate-binding protein